MNVNNGMKIVVNIMLNAPLLIIIFMLDILIKFN